MQLLSLSFRLKSPPLNREGGEKRLLLCRPDSSFPQPMAAVPEGPKATPATGSFGEFKLLYKNINQSTPRDESPGSRAYYSGTPVLVKHFVCIEPSRQRELSL
jgi:hypothetical protein